VATVRRADTRKKRKAVAVVAAPDNDWWSWATIGTVSAVSTSAVWLPVIIGVGA
jgi:hypothetical protein